MPLSTKSTIWSTSSTPGISCPVMARMTTRAAEHLDSGGHRGVGPDLAPADRALEDGDGIVLRTLVRLAVERGDALVAQRLLDRGPDVVGSGRRVHEVEHRGEHRVQVPADRPGVRWRHLVAVELLHRGDREVFLARPASVDGRLADARGAGHLVHGHAVEAAHQDQGGGCREDAPVCFGVARTAALAAYLGDGWASHRRTHFAGFHAVEHRFACLQGGNFSRNRGISRIRNTTRESCDCVETIPAADRNLRHPEWRSLGPDVGQRRHSRARPRCDFSPLEVP